KPGKSIESFIHKCFFSSFRIFREERGGTSGPCPLITRSLKMKIYLYNMKKILLAFFLLLSSVAHAQLNNSWIDYSKTYYKFKLGQTGLYRINESVLSAAGLASIPAEQFQLWRNGKQIRIYTSVPTGIMGGSDYIEFWG